jgi:hypothetical protein
MAATPCLTCVHVPPCSINAPALLPACFYTGVIVFIHTVQVILDLDAEAKRTLQGLQKQVAQQRTSAMRACMPWGCCP